MKRIILLVSLLAIAVSAIAQSGGGYNLEQNVIGSGGWKSVGGQWTLLGTMGQGNAGSTAAGGGFHLIDGLWATENGQAASPFAVIAGRVVNEQGAGIPRVRMTIVNTTTNLTYEVYTQAQGYYSFIQVPTGGNYLVTPSHRRFTFDPGSFPLFVSQDRSNLDFTAVR